jgi:tripartite-type tricarboxylate transporter receptor subunit TctC
MLNPSRRTLLALVAGAALLSSPSAWGADAYPDRPVTLIVPSAPGGTTDFTARLLAEGLTRELGQQFIVDNKGGASGNIGIGQAARAEPDGYTLLLTYSGYQVNNPSLFKNLKWDPIEDLAPVALAIKAPHVFLVRKDLPVNSIADLIAYGKEHPGELNYASSGNGSIQHIGGEQFMQQTGIEMTHVPYKGAGPAMTDLLGGVVDVFITTPPSAAGHIRNKAVKALALAGRERQAMLPDIPTMAEAGVPGFELEAWFALYAPAGTPQPIIDTLASAAEKVVTSEGYQKQATDQGTYAAFMGPAELGKFTESEIAHWGEVITKAGIALD